MNVIINQPGIAAKSKKKSYVHSCPKCNLALIQRVHRANFIRTLFPWLPVRRYICYRCKKKYHVYHKE